LGFSPIQSGMLMMPQAIAAMSLKMTMPKILERLGYRGVLIGNTLILPRISIRNTPGILKQAGLKK